MSKQDCYHVCYQECYHYQLYHQEHDDEQVYRSLTVVSICLAQVIKLLYTYKFLRLIIFMNFVSKALCIKICSVLDLLNLFLIDEHQ